jgi:hypothetical protein
MNLTPRYETLAQNESHKWLGSKHGTDSPSPIVIDGAAFNAIYSDNMAKSGTIVAFDTSINRWVPFDNAGSNGRNVAGGILYVTIDLRVNVIGASPSYQVSSPAAILRHGQVITPKLPRTSSQIGGPHANAISGLPNIIFRAA